MKNTLLIFTLLASYSIMAQLPSDHQLDLYRIIDEVSADRIEKDVRTLASFGTRNTFSDTISDTRGIGAARRWIKAQFDQISASCGNCLEVFYQKDYVTKEMGNRIPKDAWVVNVVAIQRGTDHPNDMVMMSGDIDSRASDTMDFTTDAPGANDNASGMAGTIEAARVLSKRKFKNSIVYVGLSGEEQGLFGGKGLATYAQKEKWNVIGFLNNDMIGNIKGVDGVIDNREFRIFSEPTDPTETERQRSNRRFYGGEVDGISRQLARYIHKSVTTYMPSMKPMMVYRLDRFGRGGHHRPFTDLGFPGIRIMEAHENYTQQHQDIRTENGIAYGDVIEHVNFPYAKKLTAVNAINLAQLAWAPTQPQNVKIGGIVEADVKLQWDKVKNAVGYKIYWRDTTSPTWDHSRYVGDVQEFTLTGIVIDNSFFGVAAVGADGMESIVTFPTGIFR
jgi:Zn-dependent M28 family amino/carboxypeptidase